MLKVLTYFNGMLYSKIREERKRLGLPVMDLTVEISDHPLIGREMLNTSNNIVYIVQSVYKQWQLGWYYALLLIKSNGSSVLRIYENINSGDSIICAKARDAQEELVILDSDTKNVNI